MSDVDNREVDGESTLPVEPGWVCCAAESSIGSARAAAGAVGRGGHR
jgi:hypothetical protein